MSLWKIAWRSILQRRVASLLTAVSMGLGVSLVVAVLVIHKVVEQSFASGGEGYDLIVGPKGGKLQLILNSVYYLDQSLPSNLPYSFYQKHFVEKMPLESDQYIDEEDSDDANLKFHDFTGDIVQAVPICMGHSFLGESNEYAHKNFKVVGTTSEFFKHPAAPNLTKGAGSDDETTEKTDSPEEDRLKFEFLWGRPFSDNGPFEAVIGATVARSTDLMVSDRTVKGEKIPDRTFKAACGAAERPNVHGDRFTVVGVLAPTGTPADRALYVNIDGFYQLHGEEVMETEVTVPPPPADTHNTEPSDPTEMPSTDGPDPSADQVPEDNPAETADVEGCGIQGHPADCACGHSHEREISAILVCVSQYPEQTPELAQRWINRTRQAQAVDPIKEIAKFFEGVIGNIQKVLLVLTIVTVVVAGMGIMVSIYNSMSDRRREIAIMRALGASRSTVMMVILLESILLSLGGGVIGLVIGHGLIAALSGTIAENTGVIVHWFQFQSIELYLVPGLIVLAAIVGYLPAAVAYRTDVAKSLTQHP